MAYTKLTNEEVLKRLNDKKEYIFKGKEKDFEDKVILNIENICKNFDLTKIEKVERQKKFVMEDFIIIPDLIVYHIDGSCSVFEIKCNNVKNMQINANEQTKAIGQILLYKSCLKSMFGFSPRMFLVDTKIYKRTMMIFGEIGLPITLIQIQDDDVFVPYAKHSE